MSFAICLMCGLARNLRLAQAAAASVAVVAVLVMAGTPAGAADAVFTVHDIAVDETAETAAVARTAAFRVGQRRALATLLRRLTLRADHRRLPAVRDERLDFLVQALEVADEKTSDVRYLAKLTVNFKPPEIRRLLREAGIPFAETPSKPTLILPVMRRDGAYILWDEPNPWRAAWADMPSRDGLVPLIVPVGDLSDIADVDASQAVEGDPLRLAAIADRYGAGDVLVALATVSPGAGGAPRLDVTATRVGAPSQAPILRTFEGLDPADPAPQMRAAAEAVALAVEDAWKSANIIQFDRSARLRLAIPLTSLEQWVTIESRLNDIATISQVVVQSITRDAATVEIVHFGSEAQLAEAMAQQDLSLEPAVMSSGDPFRTIQSNAAVGMRVLRFVAP